MGKTELEFTDDPNELPRLNLIAGGQRARRDALRPSMPVADLERLAQDWVSEAQYLQQSPSTIAGKRDAVAKLVWWLRREELPACSTKELRRFLAYIGNGHLDPEGRWGNARLTTAPSTRTIQAYFNYLRIFCRWLHSEGEVEESLMRGLAVPRPEQHQVQPFSGEHISALLQAARASEHPKRDEAILLFMLDTGVRASEICGLRMRDVDLHGSYGQATVLGKGRKKRALPFSRKAARALWSYLRESPPRADSSSLFLSDRGPGGAGAPLTRSGLLQLFERLGKAGGVRNVRCSPHTMRHTFAINFLRAGGNTFTLQAMLGHTALHMTQKYVKIAEADVVEQHRQFSPADRMGK